MRARLRASCHAALAARISCGDPRATWRCSGRPDAATRPPKCSGSTIGTQRLLEADVTIERLGQSAEKDEGIPRAEFSDEIGWDGTNALEVLAHVAGAGDISVPTGEWIAGPESPARVEGFSLKCKWRDPSRHPD